MNYKEELKKIESKRKVFKIASEILSKLCVIKQMEEDIRSLLKDMHEIDPITAASLRSADAMSNLHLTVIEETSNGPE